MISIIICSKDLNLFSQIQKSIKETIGVIAYEIIRIDNSIKNLSITKAYNIGINKSKYEYLVFVHEDVLFHTINWGKILVNIFNLNPKIGLMGVAGTKYKSKYPSAFWHTKEDFLNINLIQHYPHKPTSHFKLGFNENHVEKVVAIDGVFIALKKSIGVHFNEEIIGFHCYDLGISIDVLDVGHHIVVTDQILIEHFSIGNTNLDFINGVIKFHDLYKKKLPKSIDHKNKNLASLALKKFLELCLDNKMVPSNLWIFNIAYSPFDKLNYQILKLKIDTLKMKFKVNG
ncbi:glycosyltransferase family protein [Flavobacterium sp. TR2]|uniref:glycosyltransferase family protein n=1 Tax=Flavobacterium sp. TR2 TaxID=2977321 RepID=UPI0021B09C57|nr:glycosyltransferase family protein [Flavobacterium sp. TR2]UWY28611.1 glycosyltransferase family protein [Flavobacterium sp. TR2]